MAGQGEFKWSPPHQSPPLRFEWRAQAGFKWFKKGIKPIPLQVQMESPGIKWFKEAYKPRPPGLPQVGATAVMQHPVSA